MLDHYLHGVRFPQDNKGSSYAKVTKVLTHILYLHIKRKLEVGIRDVLRGTWETLRIYHVTY